MSDDDDTPTVKPIEFWIGGFGKMTNSWLAFDNPPEHLKPKLIHVVNPIAWKNRVHPKVKCKYDECNRLTMGTLKVCQYHYQKEWRENNQ